MSGKMYAIRITGSTGVAEKVLIDDEVLSSLRNSGGSEIITEEAIIDTEQMEVIQEVDTIPGNSEFHWTTPAIRQLLELRLSREDEFQRPLCKKKRIWNKIAQEMRDKGFVVTGQICDNKFRNLLTTYRTNRKKVTESGIQCTSWEYYSMFDKVYGQKNLSSLKKRPLHWDTAPSSISMDNISEGVISKKTRQFLEEKYKFEREKFEWKKEAHARLEDLDRQRTQAILKLAEVLRNYNDSND